jgi:glycosyltransferase involved in cell wall biosynthesis
MDQGEEMKIHFVTACRNIASNAEALVRSVKEQTNSSWVHTIVDDCSTDETHDRLIFLTKDDSRFRVIKNDSRQHALRNIVGVARSFQEDEVVATLDGDDALCNPKTVDILTDAYERGADVVWTAHRWDTNGMNISGHLPDRVDPYAWPWVSSHLRTFRASLLSRISDENFINHRGEWFKRGYDQALMLPVLHVAERRAFLPEVCYQYNINSASIPSAERNWAEVDQISTVNIVRARGFLG